MINSTVSSASALPRQLPSWPWLQFPYPVNKQCHSCWWGGSKCRWCSSSLSQSPVARIKWQTECVNSGPSQQHWAKSRRSSNCDKERKAVGKALWSQRTLGFVLIICALKLSAHQGARGKTQREWVPGRNRLNWNHPELVYYYHYHLCPGPLLR